MGDRIVHISKMKVQEAMARKGVNTQTELAEMLGITKNQLSVILSKRYQPLKSGAVNLCNVLEVSPFEILEEEGREKNYMTTNNIKETTGKYAVKNQLIVHMSKKGLLDEPGRINAIELFAGAGGLALGLERSGIKAVACVEIDKYCCETLRRNRPNWNVIESDIHDVDFSLFNGQVDIVTGGFPCQAFSYAGKKLGFEDTRGTLFYEFARCIKEVEPSVFMAENVRGLISHDNGRTLETMLEIFRELGYNVEYKLLNSVDYGVPQKRQRIIIIGTKPGVLFEFPEEEKEIKTIGDALQGVPKSEGQQYSKNKRKVLDLVPPGGCWRDLPLEIQKEYMGKSFYSSGGRTGMARRMSWDEPCLTLTCSPSQKQTERCHPEETRPFTVREYARIQTFPDDWEFAGGLGEQYKQIGNAVPVELAYKLGLQLVEAIESINSKNKKTKVV